MKDATWEGQYGSQTQYKWGCRHLNSRLKIKLEKTLLKENTLTNGQIYDNFTQNIQPFYKFRTEEPFLQVMEKGLLEKTQS